MYLDGGSSGTRVHVFQYTLAPWPQYARLVLPELSQAAEPGLSHFADQPEAAGTSLHKLLEFAHQQVGFPCYTYLCTIPLVCFP